MLTNSCVIKLLIAGSYSGSDVGDGMYSSSYSDYMSRGGDVCFSIILLEAFCPGICSLSCVCYFIEGCW